MCCSSKTLQERVAASSNGRLRLQLLRQRLLHLSEVQCVWCNMSSLQLLLLLLLLQLSLLVGLACSSCLLSQCSISASVHC
jgi:hypothetical protein